MLVVQLIGRQAGAIIDLPYHAASAALSCGSARQPTEAEIAVHEGRAPEPAATPAAPPPVEIPDGWADLPFADLQALAILIARAPVKAKADAVAIIEAELAARSATTGSAATPAA